MTAPRAPLTDQNKVTESPGATATTSVVKNSMRGALGLATRVGLVSAATFVLVAPKIEVAVGPPSVESGLGVAVALTSGVKLAVGGRVKVAVGR
jgi:hypothetical protein